LGGNKFTDEIEEWSRVLPCGMSDSVVCLIREAKGL